LAALAVPAAAVLCLLLPLSLPPHAAASAAKEAQAPAAVPNSRRRLICGRPFW
jgi:hypothetical protein